MSAADKPLLWAAVASLVLAALSAAVLPTVPSYDPWAWIVWGRELVDPHLSFATGGGPSWKPLPVVFTALYGLFGAAAPTLWVITARAGGLLGLIAAWRLASGLTRGTVGRRPAAGARRDDRPASLASLGGWLAGAVTVVGIALTQDYFYYMFRGTSEPLLVAGALWWLERLLGGHHRQAFLIAVALSLLRPEAWPFLGCYALWLWVRQQRMRPLIAAGLLALPLLWLVPPWIGSGQPLLAAQHAHAYNGHLGHDPLLTALRRSVDLQIAPVLVLAGVALVLSWRGRAAVLVNGLCLAALIWVAIVVAMVALGYPGLERFFLPASALLCVVAGVGFASLVLEAGERVGAGLGRRRRWPLGRAASVVVAAALLTLSVPLAVSRIGAARAAEPAARQAVRILDQLSAAVRATGGKDAVFPCRSSFAAINHGAQTALAWKLRVSMGRIGTALTKPGVDFVGPHVPAVGISAPVAAALSRRQILARAGVWRVLRVSASGRSDPCVGH